MRLISAGSLVRAQSGPLHFRTSISDFRFSALRFFRLAFAIRPFAVAAHSRRCSKLKIYERAMGQWQGTAQAPDFQIIAAWWPFTNLHLFARQGQVRRNRIGFGFPRTLSVNFQGRMEKGMKTESKIGGHIIRGGTWAVLLSVAFIAATSAFDSSTTAKASSQSRAFSFAERVAYQRIIEDVYWRHRIWPKENPARKPSLDAVISQAQLENKVAGYLRDSLALKDYGQPISAEQLQAEMDRIARDTKQPGVLQELFEALGKDPAVIAECLARPILVERLIADFSVQDQTRRLESPQTEAPRTMSAVTSLGQVVYTLPEIANACTDQWGATSTTNAPSARSWHTAVWTGSEMI